MNFTLHFMATLFKICLVWTHELESFTITLYLHQKLRGPINWNTHVLCAFERNKSCVLTIKRFYKHDYISSRLRSLLIVCFLLYSVVCLLDVSFWYVSVFWKVFTNVRKFLQIYQIVLVVLRANLYSDQRTPHNTRDFTVLYQTLIIICDSKFPVFGDIEFRPFTR